jgi:hypothetical protein
MIDLRCSVCFECSGHCASSRASKVRAIAC